MCRIGIDPLFFLSGPCLSDLSIPYGLFVLWMSRILVRVVRFRFSGGYCGGVPPLPIPNREVKPACADGTAMQCGRVGGRLFFARSRPRKLGRDLFRACFGRHPVSGLVLPRSLCGSPGSPACGGPATRMPDEPPIPVRRRTRGSLCQRRGRKPLHCPPSCPSANSSRR